MPVYAWIAVSLAGILLVLLVDSALGRWIWRDDSVSFELVAEGPGTDTAFILPGFINPSAYLGESLGRTLDSFHKVYVAKYSQTDFDWQKIYWAMFNLFDNFWGGKRIFVFGHSMGGQVGTLLALKATPSEGLKPLPINKLVLDCTPSTGYSLRAPRAVITFLRWFLKIYSGGPLGLLVAAGFHWLMNKKSPLPVSKEVDAKWYHNYAMGMRWYPNRAAIAQFKFMLNFELPEPLEKGHTPEVLIIANDNPGADKDPLVCQFLSIADWTWIFPDAQIVSDPLVKHANPVEQPKVYADILKPFLSTAAER